MARPTACKPDLANRICERLAGGESLRSICEAKGMPNKSTVLLWVVSGREVVGTGRKFSDQYREAREAAGFSHADEAMDLRNELRGGQIDPQSAKVILDALKWGAERMAPKYHSSRQEIDHQSSDGTMTPQPAIDASKLSTETLKELRAARDSSGSDE